jgi:glycogen(starch) synthase
VRVLMLSWEYPPHVVGGLGKHVAELVPALGAQRVEMHLVTPLWVNGKYATGYQQLATRTPAIHQRIAQERAAADW